MTFIVSIDQSSSDGDLRRACLQGQLEAAFVKRKGNLEYMFQIRFGQPTVSFDELIDRS